VPIPIEFCLSYSGDARRLLYLMPSYSDPERVRLVMPSDAERVCFVFFSVRRYVSSFFLVRFV
jgi:hypothetical protein